MADLKSQIALLKTLIDAITEFRKTHPPISLNDVCEVVGMMAGCTLGVMDEKERKDAMSLIVRAMIDTMFDEEIIKDLQI